MFMAALTGVSLAYPSYTGTLPDGIKVMICETLSPETIRVIKCKDPEFLRQVREHSIGISPEELCSDPHGVFEKLCRSGERPMVYAKLSQEHYDICIHGPNFPGIAQWICKELPMYCGQSPLMVYHKVCRASEVQQTRPDDLGYLCRSNLPADKLKLLQRACAQKPEYCDLPPHVVYSVVCGYGQKRAEAQQPRPDHDLGFLCSLDLPEKDLSRRVCEEIPQLCGQPIEKLCSNHPRPRSFARSQQPSQNDPTRPKPLFFRVIELCNSSESNVNQNLEALCEGLPSWIRHGRVLPPSVRTPITEKVQEFITNLCKEKKDPLVIPAVETSCNTWKVESCQICNEQPTLQGCTFIRTHIQP